MSTPGVDRALHQAEIFGATDVGKVRKTNEDQFLVAYLDPSGVDVVSSSLPHTGSAPRERAASGQLLVVADGVGGERGGERASQVAVTTMTGYLARYLPVLRRMHDQGGDEEITGALKLLVHLCEAAVEQAAERADHPRMGTTFTMACVLWPKLFVVHVGDTRCYLLRHRALRGDTLEQVTTDHSVAQQLVEAGALEPEQAKTSRFKNVLWNALSGPDGRTETIPDVYEAKLEEGDTLLLCSDGLTKHVGDDAIREHLRRAGTASAACTSLIAAANEGGGTDNITVVVARL